MKSFLLLAALVQCAGAFSPAIHRSSNSCARPRVSRARVLPVMKLNPKQDELLIAFKAGQLERVKALLDAGAAVDRARDDGATPLLMASQNGHLEVVKALLDAGATVDRVGDIGNTPPMGDLSIGGTLVTSPTPLILASFYGHLEVVKALLDAGATLLTPW